MRHITTAIAAIALVASGAHAQGNGKGGDKGGGKPAAAQQGGGGQSKGQGNGRAADKGGGPSMAQSMRAGDSGNGKAKANERGKGNAMADQRGNGGGGPSMRSADRGNDKAKDARGNGQGSSRSAERAADNGRGRGNDDRTVAIDRRDGRFEDDRFGDDGRVRRLSDLGSVRSRGLIDGCPPGLAKKNPPCVPPGQVRNGTNRLLGYDRPDWWGLSGLSAGRYLYDDGYLMRLGSDGRVGGFIPLLGGALGIGNAWPGFYEPVQLPGYYESYYDLGPYNSYRYADDVIYRVDPDTAAITSIAALLTGDDFSVGQSLPLGYDVYNVPYAYRDRYVDGPDALYRYSDGYVYEVDPTTRLIATAIELIAS